MVHIFHTLLKNVCTLDLFGNYKGHKTSHKIKLQHPKL